MTTEHHKPDHVKRTNGSAKSDFVHRARLLATALPSRIDQRLKRNPYAVVGIACAVGMGIGIVASSRILRAALTAAATAALIDLGRAYIQNSLVSVERPVK
jgi:hypothetical protein